MKASLVLVAVVVVALSCGVAAYLPPEGRSIWILHTTDVHGWINGHKHNSTLDATFAHYGSLVEHLTARAKAQKAELFLFDSGDITEGTGLSDATPVHGELIFPIFAKIKDYTALTMGNHDIGHANTVNLMSKTFIKHFNEPMGNRTGAYLTANSRDRLTGSPLGDTHYVVQTDLGTRMLVLGFMFNFTHNAWTTTVDTVSETLESNWFAQAMQESDLDLIAVTMHIDPESTPEMDQIYTAIRSWHRDIPIALFAGHRHRRYFNFLDPNCFVIESHKYFQSLGLVQFHLEETQQQYINFRQQWIDTSIENFAKLANVPPNMLMTPLGHEIETLLDAFTNLLELNKTIGCSPITYSPWVDRGKPNSLHDLYIENIVPKIVFNHTLPNTQFFLSNMATLRSELYQGVVTVDDMWAISPFDDVFHYYAALTGEQLIALLKEVHAPAFTTHYLKTTSRVFDPEHLPLIDVSHSPFTHSNMRVDPNGVYDMLVSTYDSKTLEPVFKQLFPDQEFVNRLYPTKYTSTNAIGEYVYEFMPCNE